MGLLNDVLSGDAQFAHADADMFPGNETVTFTPKGGSSRSIVVQIQRHAAEAIPGTIQGFAAYADIWIINHATLGATSLTIGGDKITFAPRQGETAVETRITELVDQDAGMWHVRIRING